MAFLKSKTKCCNNSNGNTSFQNITCSVPQGSFLGPQLFILYIIDLRRVSNGLDVTIFGDNTDLFISDKVINPLFTKASLELQKMNEWFEGNKLLLNTKKVSAFSAYHKSTQKDNLPLAPPIPRIDGVELKRKANVKFSGVLLDENLTWKDRINTIENKFSKNIRLIFRAKNVLNKDSLTKLCYSYIRCLLIW